MRDALRSGVTLDELWKVGRGEVKYADFMSGRQGQGKRRETKEPPQVSEKRATKEPPRVPEELVRCPISLSHNFSRSVKMCLPLHSTGTLPVSTFQDDRIKRP